MNKDIIDKIEESGLVGRSGSGYPTGLKWKSVKNSVSEKKYIICNASEGEPGMFKDAFILENYPEEVISGMKIALEIMDGSSAYIYLNGNYYRKFKKILEDLSEGCPILLIERKGGYISGEETSIMEVIEGRPAEPRIKPPFPTESGLWGYPTLINNVETFYWISKISKGEYLKKRFVCISGDINNGGVFEFSEDDKIADMLQKTDNFPDFDFFIQAGGGACGKIMLPKELKSSLLGSGSIIVYDRKKTDPYELMKKWIDFFLEDSCNKCVPCREGLYRISEMIKNKMIDNKEIDDIFFTLEKTSFCPLGKIATIPFKTLIQKII